MLRALSPAEQESLKSPNADAIQEPGIDLSKFLLTFFDEADKLFNLSSLPDDAGDTLRIIRIGDYDACPCRGTACTFHEGDRRVQDHLNLS